MTEIQMTEVKNFPDLSFSDYDQDTAYAISCILTKTKIGTCIDVKSSSGSSIVVIPYRNFNNKNSKENLKVYQYFFAEGKAREIFEIMNKLNKSRKVYLQLPLQSVVLDFYENLPEIVSYIPDRILVWKRILCLNELPSKNLIVFLVCNYCKFLWDIGKALHGLHSSGIVHKDVSIDNIGYNIEKNKFVLFDFNLSRVLISVDRSFENDFHVFYRSIKFRLFDVWSKIRTKTPKSYNSTSFLNDVLSRNKTTVQALERTELVF